MDKLIRARKGLAQNSKKGFTLVELIVVIVIIAILVAALIPAVMGAISQANAVADQADARTILTAASVAALGPDGGVIALVDANIGTAISGGFVSLHTGMIFTIYLDSASPAIPVGASWTNGRGPNGFIGTVTTHTHVLPAIPAPPPAGGA